MSPRLQGYLEGLLRTDPHFRRFWRCRTSQEQDRYLEIWRTCDQLADQDIGALRDRQEAAYLETRRWFSLVQEIGFSYSRIPEDWVLVADDRPRQYRIYRRNRDALTRFLGNLGLTDVTELYGGVKPSDSIRRKAYGNKDGNAVQRNVLDTWDLVRFRIRTSNMYSLLKIGMAIWDRYFDDVLRCRNYYFYPRGGDPEDAYRALHFELRDRRGGMFEVQVMTLYREAVSLLDHAPRFKRMVDFVDNEHEAWLVRVSFAANIMEFEKEDIAPFEAMLGRRR